MADLSDLSGEELGFAEALLALVEADGRFDGTGLWIGYEPVEDNEDTDEGVNCSNCVFFDGPSGCQLLEQTVEAGARCRLIVIPPSVRVGTEFREVPRDAYGKWTSYGGAGRINKIMDDRARGPRSNIEMKPIPKASPNTNVKPPKQARKKRWFRRPASIGDTHIPLKLPPR